MCGVIFVGRLLDIILYIWSGWGICVRGIPDPVRAPALQHSGGRSDGLFGLPELGLSLVGSLQGRSAIHSCNSTVGHAWRGLNSLLWLALSWGLLGLVIYTTTDPLNS